jgi:hypothetical protein
VRQYKKTAAVVLMVLLMVAINVRFQKEMRLVSLEIPEPGASGYQNLMRQDPNLTRSDATRSTLRPKLPTISRKTARTSG